MDEKTKFLDANLEHIFVETYLRSLDTMNFNAHFTSLNIRSIIDERRSY